jgi:hypothetical protein
MGTIRNVEPFPIPVVIKRSRKSIRNIGKTSCGVLDPLVRMLFFLILD